METDRFTHLVQFAIDVLEVCDQVGVDPIMDGSMAVKAYTNNPGITVGDIDFNCPESDFSRLKLGLEKAGVFCEIQPWHVLQARRGGLKVEFGAIDVWMANISGSFESFPFGEHTVRMVNKQDLTELYRRGFEATSVDESELEKHLKIGVRLRALEQANL